MRSISTSSTSSLATCIAACKPPKPQPTMATIGLPACLRVNRAGSFSVGMALSIGLGLAERRGTCIVVRSVLQRP